MPEDLPVADSIQKLEAKRAKMLGKPSTENTDKSDKQ
jgi:hypothetical protein